MGWMLFDKDRTEEFPLDTAGSSLLTTFEVTCA
jgi:hypothetical protein